MGIVKTYIRNNKTIRVWEQSYGQKTLTRRFYVNYRVIMVTDKYVESKIFSTLSLAKKGSLEWMNFIGNNWRKYNEICTHIEDTAWRCFSNGINAKCYICSEGGSTISEIIK